MRMLQLRILDIINLQQACSVCMLRIPSESRKVFHYYSEFRIISAGHRIPPNSPSLSNTMDVERYHSLEENVRFQQLITISFLCLLLIPWDFSPIADFPSTWRHLVQTHLLGIGFCFQAAQISSPVIGRTHKKNAVL